MKKSELIVGPEEVKSVLKTRKPESHKGDFGRVLVIGGSKDYSGAIILAALGVSALRAGTDIVTVAAPEKVAWAINTIAPDIITKKIDGEYFTKEHVNEIAEFSKNFDVVLFGPGISMNSEEFCKEIVKKIKKPMVIDADALKSINAHDVKGTILTPHSKEFEILFKTKLPVKLEDKIKLLKKVAGENIILLKGNPDIIASSNKVKLNYTGNPAMTVGGTGDVLAGLCAGFLAQSNDLFKSACAAAYVNGLAGDIVQKEIGYGLIASDLLKAIPKIIKEITKHGY